MPFPVAAAVVNAVIILIFTLRDIVAGSNYVGLFSIQFLSHWVSLYLAMFFLVHIRDTGVRAFEATVTLLKEPSSIDRMKLALSVAFNQRRMILFGLMIGVGGITHHTILSLMEWGKIWWYSIVDIVLIGFAWWFVVGTFLWVCVSFSYSLYKLTKLNMFKLSIVTRDRCCGLSPIGGATVLMILGWASVVSVGTITTFYFETVMNQLLVTVYLALDLLIISGSMAFLFVFSLGGFRYAIRTFKFQTLDALATLSERLNQEARESRGAAGDSFLRGLYIACMFNEAEKIREWPAQFADLLKFVFSYAIPLATFIVGLWIK